MAKRRTRHTTKPAPAMPSGSPPTPDWGTRFLRPLPDGGEARDEPQTAPTADEAEAYKPFPTETAVNPERPSRKLLIGVPTLGIIRMEWHIATSGAIIPCNWEAGWQIPFGYLTHDAQNIICHTAINTNVDWVLFIEDDVLIPPDFYLRLERWIKRGDVPIVSGIYHLKNSPDREPLIYRGRGNGAFRDFKYGEAVWVDGVPTGCILIHTSILKELAKDAPLYEVRNQTGTQTIKQIFVAPRLWFNDPASNAFNKLMGTSDLYFCDQLRERGILKKAGWAKVAAKKNPYLVDTAMCCDHIDRDTGRRW